MVVLVVECADECSHYLTNVGKLIRKRKYLENDAPIVSILLETILDATDAVIELAAHLSALIT